MKLKWTGKDENERGIDKKTGKVLVEVDPRYYRPTEVELLRGDYSKAKRKLGWEPKVKFEELVKIMAKTDWGKGEGERILRSWQLSIISRLCEFRKEGRVLIFNHLSRSDLEERYKTEGATLCKKISQSLAVATGKKPGPQFL